MTPLIRALFLWLQSPQSPEDETEVIQVLREILIRGDGDLANNPAKLSGQIDSLLADAAGVVGRAGIDTELPGNVVTPKERQERVDPVGTFRRFALQGPEIAGLSDPFRARALNEQAADDAYARYMTQAAQQRLDVPFGVPGITFMDFLGGGRPTSQNLASSLGNIADLFGLAKRTGQQEEAYGQFAGDLERQFMSAIQPRLQSLSPALQPGYRRVSRAGFNEFKAQNPEMPFLPYAKTQGYWS